MSKLFNILKNPYFWPIFGPFSKFLGKKYFLENLADMHNFIWISSTMPKFRKTNNKIPRKYMAGRTDIRFDRQTLFHRTLLATARGPIYQYISRNERHKWQIYLQNRNKQVRKKCNTWVTKPKLPRNTKYLLT